MFQTDSHMLECDTCGRRLRAAKVIETCVCAQWKPSGDCTIHRDPTRGCRRCWTPTGCTGLLRIPDTIGGRLTSV